MVTPLKCAIWPRIGATVALLNLDTGIPGFRDSGMPGCWPRGSGRITSGPMTIIVFATGKGGAGKSLTACGLAAEWARRGLRVLLADADPQGTCEAWAAVAQELERDFRVSVMGVGDSLRTSLPAAARAFDVTLVDTAGKQSRRLAGALMVCDQVIIPTAAGASDLWALGATLDTIAQARELRDFDAAMLINNRPHTALGANLRASLAATDLPVLRSELGNRTAFVEAMAAGQGVVEYAPRSVAALEMLALGDELEDRLGIMIPGIPDSKGTANAA